MPLPVGRLLCSRARTHELEASSSPASCSTSAARTWFVHRCELHQTRVQTLQLCLRHAVEIHTRWVVLAGPLQPAQEDLRCARVRGRLLAQPTLATGSGREVCARPTSSERRSPSVREVPLPVGRLLCSRARTRARGQLVVGEHLLNQRREDAGVHRCELHQTRVQMLQLCFRHAVEIHTRWVVLTGPLQPAQEDLRCARVCDRLLAQTTLDLRITRRLTATATVCAALRLNRAASRASSFVHRCGRALVWSACASAMALVSFSSAVSNRLRVTHRGHR